MGEYRITNDDIHPREDPNDDCLMGEPGCDCAISDGDTLIVSVEGGEEEDEDRRMNAFARLAGEAPEGFEWVRLPERPGGANHGGAFTSPGETGHYSDLNPEPIQVIQAWGLDFLAGSALKYLARFPRKGGVEDLEKVKFYADQIIARERREGRG